MKLSPSWKGLSNAVAVDERPVSELRQRVRGSARRGDEPLRVPRCLPRRAADVCERGRAHPRRHRQAGIRRHLEGRPPRPRLHEPDDPDLPGLLRVLRHGGDDRADRLVLPPRRAGARGAQADPLPPRPGRRRQVVARRAPEGPDGGPPHLRAQGRQRGLAGLREPARPVRPRDHGRGDPEPLRHPAPAPHWADEPLGPQAPRRVQRRHLAVHGDQGQALAPAPDRHRQDRARRREQPGHLEPRRQGRYPPPRDPVPGRPRRLLVFGRAEPSEPGRPRIRRDVQGPDQDAPPAAHGDAGGQLCRHREYRRDPVHGRDPGPLERGRVADLQDQQEQRSLHRPHLRHQGALLPPGHGGAAHLREAGLGLRAGAGRLRSRHPGDAGPVLGPVAPARARQLEPVLQDAGL
ncbi:hypothetical protein AEGHOMDF_3423 [Methylobacterium soli]|nr:hypothetical protein AEGHOMDF_3423 [Methylobacterium soli]